MRVSRVQAEKNRRAVIDAAASLFRPRGFGGISLDEVMKAAGLTHGGFYKQFKSKEELTVEACDICAPADGHEPSSWSLPA
jgi:TetR/AcrR family transcriptional regulator, transcriptional repressor for nem operon